MRTREGNSTRKSGLQPAAAFTLVEALVSVTILAGMILMLATIFRQSSQVSSVARGGAAAFQAARQVFESIGRDLAGVTRDGFLFVRTQELRIATGDEHSGLILCFDEDGNPIRMNKGRLDVMVMTTAGYQSSAVDAGRTANFARVIWGQTERANGNNLPAVDNTQKFWGVNLVLSRLQTLMLPDSQSADLSNGSYSGSNRGPDSYNMAIRDLTRFFAPAMGHGGETNLPTLIDSFGVFSTFYGEGSQELTPYRRSSKVWRFGRSGKGPGGESPGAEGAGDLTPAQVDIEQTVPSGMFTSSYAPAIVPGFEREPCIRGQERPKVFGPKDYYRIAAFGVASFQVDWSDGRRVAKQDSSGNYVGTELQFYPENRLGNYSKLYMTLMGPGERRTYSSGGTYTTGEKRTYCWNQLSPGSIRDTSIRKAFGGVTYTRKYYSWSNNYDPPSGWADISWYTQSMFLGECSMGGGGLGDGGWPWPRVVRVRLLIYDTTQDPPTGYLFEQIFHLLVQ
jgi:type II secretory pathway pseudopilin PulG